MGILFSVPDCRRNSPDGQKDIRFTGLGNWDKNPVYSNFFYFFRVKVMIKSQFSDRAMKKQMKRGVAKRCVSFFGLFCYISGRFSGCTNCVIGRSVLVQNQVPKSA